MTYALVFMIMGINPPVPVDHVSVFQNLALCEDKARNTIDSYIEESNLPMTRYEFKGNTGNRFYTAGMKADRHDHRLMMACLSIKK
jgi:hypothetical protein